MIYSDAVVEYITIVRSLCFINFIDLLKSMPRISLQRILSISKLTYAERLASGDIETEKN